MMAKRRGGVRVCACGCVHFVCVRGRAGRIKLRSDRPGARPPPSAYGDARTFTRTSDPSGSASNHPYGTPYRFGLCHAVWSEA